MNLAEMLRKADAYAKKNGTTLTGLYVSRDIYEALEKRIPPVTTVEVRERLDAAGISVGKTMIRVGEFQIHRSDLLPKGAALPMFKNPLANLHVTIGWFRE